MAEDSTIELDAFRKVSLLQAFVRGYLTRKKLREAQEMYQEIVESIEGSAKARELQWVVHGRLPIPVHKYKEPELSDFLKRLTDRVPVDGTSADRDGSPSSSKRDTDAGTYTVTTSDKYSSLTTDESSSLSGKTTSLLDSEITDGDDDAVGTRYKTSRHTSDAKQSGEEESVDKHEELREVKPVEKNDTLKSNGRKMESKEKCEIHTDSMDTVGNEDGEEKCTQREDFEMNELSRARQQNSRNRKMLEFHTEGDGSSGRGVDADRQKFDVHLTRRSEHPKDSSGGGNGSAAANAEILKPPGENNDDDDNDDDHDDNVDDDDDDDDYDDDDDVDEQKGGDRAKGRLQKLSSSDDEEVQNKDIQTRNMEPRDVRAEGDVSRMKPDVVRTGPVVDLDESVRVDESRDTQSKHCDEVKQGSCDSQEDGTISRASPSSDDKNQRLEVSDAMSLRISDDGDGVLYDAMSVVNVTDEDGKSTHKEKRKEAEGEKEEDEDTKGKNKDGNKDDGIPFVPPSPIMSQSPGRKAKQFVSSPSMVLHNEVGELPVLSKMERLGDEGSDEDGDSTMFTKVTSLGGSLVSDQTSVWDTDSEDVPVMDRSSFPKDLSQLQTLRKNIAMELLWVQQAIESRKAYLRLKTNLDSKSETITVQKGT